ncbi:MAG: hypothetical protein NC218_03550 [Acetobacter sp.]|nr:hypothetical protein [Acetobacter sp.]
MKSEKAFTSWARQKNKKRKYAANQRRKTAHIKNMVFCPKANKPKHLYKSEAAAKKALEFVDETFRPEQKVRPQGYYYCPYCGGWHLTHYKTTKTILSRHEKKFFAES